MMLNEAIGPGPPGGMGRPEDYAADDAAVTTAMAKGMAKYNWGDE